MFCFNVSKQGDVLIEANASKTLEDSRQEPPTTRPTMLWSLLFDTLEAIFAKTRNQKAVPPPSKAGKTISSFILLPLQIPIYRAVLSDFNF